MFLKGQINAFLKRAFKQALWVVFCTTVHTVDVIAEKADRSLFAKMAGSQHCLHTQKDTPTNYLNVVVIYTRNHLFQGACLDIVNILLWQLICIFCFLFSHCVSFALLIIDFIVIFSQPSIYIDGWLYGMRMTSVVCNVPVLSQNDSTYHHSVFTT